MKYLTSWLGTIVVTGCIPLCVSPLSFANDINEVPSRWKCKWCSFKEENTLEGILSTEFLYQKQDSSYYFRRYNGMEDDSLQLNLNASIIFWGEQGEYFLVEADDLGIDSREISLDYGKTSLYNLSVSYDEINYLQLQNAPSPYQHHGNTSQLPQDWVAGSTTKNMPGLDAPLPSQTLEQKRKTWRLKGEHWINSNHIMLDLELQRDHKEGFRDFTGALGNDNAFAAQSVQLAAPQNHVTDQIETGINWHAKQGFLRIAYYGSFFSQRIDDIVWENPYVVNVNGNNFGRSSTAPDNSYQQLYTEANYRLFPHTQINAYHSVGKMEQDEVLQPYTITTSLDTPLPVNSANAKIKTQTTKLVFNSRAWLKWRFHASMQFDERNNSSDRYQYSYIVLDTSPSLVSRTTLPYSFKKEKWSSHIKYRFSNGLKLTLGATERQDKRTYQEIEKLTETTAWVNAKHQLTPYTTAQLEVLRTERNSADHSPEPSIVPHENPYLRRFYLANLHQDEYSLNINSNLNEELSLAFKLKIENQRYIDTFIGLLSRKTKMGNIDIDYYISDTSTFYGYYTKEIYEYTQSGSQADASIDYYPDWTNELKNDINTAGVGFNIQSINNRITLNVDLLYSDSIENSLLISDLEFFEQLPSINTQLHSANIKIDYSFNKNTNANISLIYEHYREDDYQVSGIDANSSSGSLLFGSVPPDYDIFGMSLSVSRIF